MQVKPEEVGFNMRVVGNGDEGRGAQGGSAEPEPSGEGRGFPSPARGDQVEPGPEEGQQEGVRSQ